MEPGSQTFARAAKALTVVALVFLALPAFITCTGYVEGLGLFVAIYLLGSVAATICILVASLKRQWKERGTGWKLLAALYGLPVLLIFLAFLAAGRR